MRIAYIVSTLKRCGPNRQLYNIIRFLDRDTFKPMIITLSPEEPDSMMDQFRKICPDIYSVQLGRIAGFLEASKKIKEILKSVDMPLLIHSQGIRPDYLNALHLKDYPGLATLRNYPFRDYPYKYGKIQGAMMARLHIYFLQKLERTFTNSEATSRQLASANNIQFGAINNGIDISGFSQDDKIKTSIREKLHIPEGARLFLSVGHLLQQKDPLTVLKGFQKAELPAEDRLLMLGDGNLLDVCRNMATQDERIILAGRVKNVEDYIRASDYFISASLTEGLPNTVLEACAGGLPVLLSNIPAHQMILAKGKNCGLIFQSGNSSDLGEKIRLLLNKDRREMANDCKNLVKEYFNAKDVSQKYQEAYRKMLINKADKNDN